MQNEIREIFTIIFEFQRCEIDAGPIKLTRQLCHMSLLEFNNIITKTIITKNIVTKAIITKAARASLSNGSHVHRRQLSCGAEEFEAAKLVSLVLPGGL